MVIVYNSRNMDNKQVPTTERILLGKLGLFSSPSAQETAVKTEIGKPFLPIIYGGI